MRIIFFVLFTSLLPALAHAEYSVGQPEFDQAKLEGDSVYLSVPALYHPIADMEAEHKALLDEMSQEIEKAGFKVRHLEDRAPVEGLTIVVAIDRVKLAEELFADIVEVELMRPVSFIVKGKYYSSSATVFRFTKRIMVTDEVNEELQQTVMEELKGIIWVLKASNDA